MPKKDEYILCPRCELNYIKKKDKYCPICKAEMSGDINAFEDLDLEICPICKINFIRPDEIMCSSCAKEHAVAGANVKEHIDDEWETYLGDGKEDLVEEDEETGEMATLTDIGEDDEIDDIELDDSELPEIEELKEEDDDEDDDLDDDDEDEDDDEDF